MSEERDQLGSLPGERTEGRGLQITAEKFARLRLNPALMERRTTSDYIASALRVAIYDGQFQDGEELNQVELAHHFRVSRVPIREALRQLQAEGLVHNEAHRKTVIVGLSVEEIVQLTEARAILEAHLLRCAAPRWDADALSRLRHLAEDTAQPGPYDYDWVQKNWEFHRGLYGASGLPVIIDMVEELHLKVERYARRTGTTERRREAESEHRGIVQELLSGNVEEAAAALQQHILNTAMTIRDRAGQG